MRARTSLIALCLMACASDKKQPDWGRTPEAATPEVNAPAAAPTPAAAMSAERAWTAEQLRPMVEKTLTVRLATDTAALKPGEKIAVAKLLEVGAIMQELYEEQKHVEAAAAREMVKGAAGEQGEMLRSIFRVAQGPIANTLENKRVNVTGGKEPVKGRNVYPWGIEKAEIEAWLEAHPDERRELLGERTVVRRAESAPADLAVLARYPALETLHPGLRATLERAPALYAVPYSIAYADRIVKAYGLLNEAADAAQSDAPELAGYLRNRARDLLSDDYESGDAAWVTADLGNVNVQIGSYETYDDELFGVKTFFSLSLLVRRNEESTALRAAIGGLQALEDSLPYARHKKVSERIPVGIYDVVADFGQARGGNTATILPNEAYLARRYGRTILLRASIMRNPELFAGVDALWRAVVAPAHQDELVSDGDFYRTLWHEIGHYLGVDATRDGRTLGDALGDTADLLEEMKSDLVSLFVAKELRARGYYDDAKLRAVYAAGIKRVLQNNKPRRDQPYQTMQLMQWNFFLARGLLRFDGGTLAIDYAKYHAVVAELLGKVLAIQDGGDKAAADAFVDEWTTWDDALHGVVAQKIRDQQRYRYTLFRYAALGE